MKKFFKNISNMYIRLYFIFFITVFFSIGVVGFLDFYSNMKFNELVSIVEEYKNQLNSSISQSVSVEIIQNIVKMKQELQEISVDSSEYNELAAKIKEEQKRFNDYVSEQGKKVGEFGVRVGNIEEITKNSDNNPEEVTELKVKLNLDDIQIEKGNEDVKSSKGMKVLSELTRVANPVNIKFNLKLLGKFILIFLFQILCIIIYLLPVYKYNFDEKSNFSQIVEKRVINLQFFLVILIFFSGISFFILRSIKCFDQFNNYFMYQNIIYFIIYSSISIFLTLIFTDNYINMKITYRVLKNNNLHGLKKGFSLTISTKIILLVFSMAMIPLVFVSVGIYGFSSKINSSIIKSIFFQEISNVDVTVAIYTIIPMLFALFTAFIFLLPQLATLLFFRKLIYFPIKKLVERMKVVGKGDFTCKSSVLTGDEIGQLRGHFNDMVEGLQEREKIRSTFGKFVSAEIAEKLIKEGGTLLEGETIETTVMFTDIRDFTNFSENLHPKDIINFLNDYFSHMCNPILENGGVINKFIGDSIMAVFSPVFGVEDHVNSAFKASIGIRKALKEFNETGKYKDIRHGVGLHTGTLIAGNVGTEERMEYTVIGDTVNVASRIESQTKLFNSDTLMSEAFYNRIDKKEFSEYKFEKFESIKVKGKSKELILYKFS